MKIRLMHVLAALVASGAAPPAFSQTPGAAETFVQPSAVIELARAVRMRHQASAGERTQAIQSLSALLSNSENLDAGAEAAARYELANLLWIRGNYSRGEDGDAALAEFERLRPLLDRDDRGQRDIWLVASLMAIRILTTDRDADRWRRAGSFSADIQSYWRPGDSVNALVWAVRAARARPLRDRAEVDAVGNEIAARLGADPRRILPHVYLQQGHDHNYRPLQPTEAEARLAVAYYEAAADGFDAVGERAGPPDYYRMIAAEILYQQARGRWGADAEAALALLQRVRAGHPIEAHRWVWMHTRELALNTLAWRDGDENARGQSRVIAAEILSAWRREDGAPALQTALLVQLADASSAAERERVFVRARQENVSSPAWEALMLSNLSNRAYGLSQRGDRNHDLAIELYREALQRAEQAGDVVLLQHYRMQLASALWWRADGWDRDAQQAVALSEAVRAASSPQNGTRAVWLQATDLATQSLTEDANDRDRLERALVLALEVLREWRDGDPPDYLSRAALAAAGLYALRREGGAFDNMTRAIAIIDDVSAMPAAAQFNEETRTTMRQLRASYAGATGRQNQAQVAAGTIQTCNDAMIRASTDWVPALGRNGSVPASERELIRRGMALCEAELVGAAPQSFEQGVHLTYVGLALSSFDDGAMARTLTYAKATLHFIEGEADANPMAPELYYIATSLMMRLADQNGPETIDFELARRALQASVERGNEHHVAGGAMLLAMAQFWREDWAGVEETTRVGAQAVSRAIGSGLNETETLEILKVGRILFQVGAASRLRVGDSAGALRYVELGRAQLLSASLRMNEADLAPAARSELQQLRAQIRQLDAAMTAADRVRQQDLDALAAMRDRATSLLSAAAPQDAGAAPSNSVIVATIAMGESAHVVLRLPNGQVRHSAAQNLEMDDVNDAAAAWREAYRRGDIAGGVSRFRTELEANLGASIRLALSAAGVRPGDRVTFLPDGAMSLLPIALLRDATTGRTLLEDYEITFAPSMRALASSERRAAAPASRGLVAFWNETLLFAQAENGFAGGRFENAMLMSPANLGSSEAALAALSNASYWHFAVHGAFNWENPRDSALQLTSNVRLTLAQLLQSGSVLGAPRLIVLSACESGLVDVDRDPNEFIGLPASFLEAGGGGVIASLWPVSDLATSLLFAKFYELHRTNGGLSPPAALRAAQMWLRGASRETLTSYAVAAGARGEIDDEQLDLIVGALLELQADPPFADPRFWGAWVYYGA